MVSIYDTFINKNILRTNIKKRNNQNEGNNLYFVLFGELRYDKWKLREIFLVLFLFLLFEGGGVQLEAKA